MGKGARERAKRKARRASPEEVAKRTGLVLPKSGLLVAEIDEKEMRKKVTGGKD